MITLGFNYSQMHDSSACIARDGALLFAVAEERISRIKHDAGFPHHAISACLEFAKVRPGDLDFIAVRKLGVNGRRTFDDVVIRKHRASVLDEKASPVAKVCLDLHDSGFDFFQSLR